MSSAADARQPSGGAFGLGVEHGRRYRLRLARYPAAAEVIEAHLEAHLGGRSGWALDAGVGRGRTARVVRTPGLRWVGCDVSAPRLTTAAESGRYRLVRSDIRTLPFPRDRFDVVCCIQVLEHFELATARSLAAALGERLVPGGLLLISVPIFPPGSVPLVRAGLRWIDRLGLSGRRGDPHSHLSHFDLSRALSLVPAGFRVTDVRGVRLFSLLGKALEDRRSWYRAHRWAGRRYPGWTVEVNISAQRPL